MATTYVVNGWRECYDRRDGGRFYVCDDCGIQEGYSHLKDCPRYWPEDDDEEAEEEEDERL